MKMPRSVELPDMIVCDERIELPTQVMKTYNAFERERVLEFRELHKDDPVNVLANSAAGLTLTCRGR